MEKKEKNFSPNIDKLYEKMPHGNTMFPIMVHEVRVGAGIEDKVSCHWHKELEILVITEGEVLITVDENTYEAKAGDMFFIPGDSLHGMTGDMDKNVTFYAIDFKYDLLDSFFSDIIRQKYFDPLRKGKLVFPTILGGSAPWQQSSCLLIEEIRSLYNEGDEGYELLIKSRLYELFYLLYRNGKVYLTDNDEVDKNRVELIKEVMEYIQNNFSEKITLEDITVKFHISEGHLCRRFKKITGVTITEYLNLYRIKRSTVFLYDTEASIGEIAGMAGFNNISYYNRTFRKYMHMTPKEYRNMHRGEGF